MFMAYWGLLTVTSCDFSYCYYSLFVGRGKPASVIGSGGGGGGKIKQDL